VDQPVRYHLGGFPPVNIDWQQLVPLIGRANAALARYDGLVASIPNAAVLLSPLTTQEAVLSSKIEGTVVTMGEVLKLEAGAGDDLAQPKRDDAEEITNYRTALRFASNSLADRPLSQSLIKETHALLMNGVRGRDKDPGNYRNEQNWVGTRGCPIADASFIPIPQAHLQFGMDNWAKYVSETRELDTLVQLAIVHAEFEALHPFKDGNGRLGRMIIPLFLYERKILSGPNFYMSGYLEARREEYIEALRRISRNGSWTEWCQFFLSGLIEQASENQARAQSIIELNRKMSGQVAEATHSEHASSAVEFLFSNPIFASSHFVEYSHIPRPTALRFLRVLRDKGVLRVIVEGSGPRPAIYAFPELLNIAEGKPLF